jgi:Zn-dependent peptidase ImmA (M78 family)
LEESVEDLKQLEDCETNFLGRKKLRTSKDWIEHHANVFAASLLMPRLTFKKAVIFIQEEIGITRNLGKIILDRQESSERDFNKIVSRIQNIFGTSKQSIIIRLESIGILKEDKSRGQHISEIFRRTLKN